MISREKILKKLDDNRDVLHAYGVRKLGLFGSYARENAGKESDLDFVVELQKKSFDSYMGLKGFLEDLFRLPVDLVLSDAIKPRIRKRILKETVYAKRL